MTIGSDLSQAMTRRSLAPERLAMARKPGILARCLLLALALVQVTAGTQALCQLAPGFEPSPCGGASQASERHAEYGGGHDHERTRKSMRE